MGIAEVQRSFTDYESGEIPEAQLRQCLRDALVQEPQLSSAFIALIEAHRRANLIDFDLQSTLNADIAQVTHPGVTMVRPRRAADTDAFAPDSWGGHITLPPIHASPRPGTDRDVEDFNKLSPDDPSQPDYSRPQVGEHTDPRFIDPSASGHTTGSTTGSSWETADRLTEVATPLYPGSVLRDRFVLVEELGRGGMGVVYKACDRSRGDVRERYVAIKILNEEFKRHPLAVRALQREARKAQKLAHPNIATVYDFDRDGGNVYMVMELLSGRSLDQVLREDGHRGIPIVRALDIVKSLTAALSYAHQQGIIHSDFKPSNAFLTGDGRVKVLDFGIARAAPALLGGEEKTTFDASQLSAISPPYASLEMLLGEAPDVRDDVYALACVTYELLTGTHPYRRIDALKAHDSGLEPKTIRKLSRTQWRALRQGLALQRAERSPSIDVFASQLFQRSQQPSLWIATGALLAAVVGVVSAALLHWNAQRSAPLERHAEVTDSVSAPAQPQPSRQSENRSGALAPPSNAALEDRSAVPEMSAPPVEPVSLDRAKPLVEDHPGDGPTGPRFEMLKEELESKAAAGDPKGASAAASALTRAAPGNPYVGREVPLILASAWGKLARREFAAGHVDEALKSLAEGRRHFGKSLDLIDLEKRYVAAGDIYDRLRSAVTINVADTQRSLESLRTQAGDEFEIAAQMLAQTLADRIADERAADRGALADRLLQSGQKLFPNYSALLGRGTPGVLANTPIGVDPKFPNEEAGTDSRADAPGTSITANGDQLSNDRLFNSPNASGQRAHRARPDDSTGVTDNEKAGVEKATHE